MAAINEKLRLYEDEYIQEKYSSVNNIAKGNLATSEYLTTTMINLYGQRSDRFPLYLATRGQGKVKTVKTIDSQYKVPIMGKPQKSDLIVSSVYSASSKIGLGKSEFVLTFASKHFRHGETLQLPGVDLLITVQGEPTPAETTGWDYKCKIFAGDANTYIPYNEVKPGRRVAGGWVAAGLINSRGTEHRSQTPSQMTNQCTRLRATYNWKGNVSKKVVTVDLPLMNGGVTKVWTEFERAELEMRFLEEKEDALWFSQYNRDANGQINDYDPKTGDIVVSGSGLLEQIPNETTYGILTEKIISKIVRTVVMQSAATGKKQFTIWTGVGGREEFHKAMAASAKSTGFSFVNNQAIGGATNSTNLAYGTYFGTYIHQDGHEITVKLLPLLDFGKRADAAVKHPESGLPSTSYDMYFIDESLVNGQPNLQFVAEEGAQMVRKEIHGMNSTSDVVSSDDMVSSIQYMDSVGIHLLNPISSFKLKYVNAAA
jgi:hypothetical protein